MIGVLAEHLHFQPSELKAMAVEDLRFWSDRLEEISARRRREANGR